MSCCCFLFIQPATPIKTNCQGCMREMLFDFSQESSADSLPIDITRRWMSRAAIGNLIFAPYEQPNTVRPAWSSARGTFGLGQSTNKMLCADPRIYWGSASFAFCTGFDTW